MYVFVLLNGLVADLCIMSLGLFVHTECLGPLTRKVYNPRKKLSHANASITKPCALSTLLTNVGYQGEHLVVIEPNQGMVSNVPVRPVRLIVELIGRSWPWRQPIRCRWQILKCPFEKSNQGTKCRHVDSRVQIVARPYRSLFVRQGAKRCGNVALDGSCYGIPTRRFSAHHNRIRLLVIFAG